MKLRLTIEIDNKDYPDIFGKDELLKREQSLLGIFGVEKYVGALVNTAVKSGNKLLVNVKLIGDAAEE
jgi:hypothetical protein